MWSVITDPIRTLTTNVIHHFIHKDFHEAVARMTIIDAFLFIIVHSIDKLGIWPRLPVFLGLLYLAIRRHLHQEYNLFNVGTTPVGVRFNHSDYPYRTADGKYNDPFNEVAGSHGTFFGRNILPVDQKKKLLKPDPMVVVTKLLARRTYKDTGKQFNIIAASWIQFMIHDWIDHLEDTKQIEISAPREVASQCPLKSFKFYKTKEIPTGFYEIKSGSLNIRTPWWDGSAIYGSNGEVLQKVRTLKDGKIKISKDGHLLHNENGTAIAGDIRNSWAGVSTLQALFIQEHNSVCDTLKKNYPHMDDEELYRHARLVTSAVIAKVHTIDWTVELLKTDTLLAGMRANWYGLLGKKFKDTFGHVGGAILGGLVGLKKPENHGVTYSLTEEFASVYRMHPLLPDNLQLRDISATPGPNKSPPLIKEIPMKNLIGLQGEKTLTEIGVAKQLVSMGHQACGALELWNYPEWLRDLVPQNLDGTERPDHVDLAALEIYRDRERSVARYNQFRRSLLLIPISKWEDLTDDQEAIQVLEEVYGDDVEELDTALSRIKDSRAATNVSNRILNPFQVLSLLKRMLDEDCELLHVAERPEKLIITNIVVPPIAIRPSVVMDDSLSNENDITERLKNIIQANAVLRQELQESTVSSKFLDGWDILQNEVAQFINSDVRGVPFYMQPTKQLAGFVQRLKGKHGRFRGNLSGKRVEYTGRTVISPDPNLKISEVAIPIHMARILTYPERVTHHNMEKLRQCVRNGPDKYPGARMLRRDGGHSWSLKVLCRKRAADELRIGDIVDRHLEDGDIVLFNRQPSLHRMSIMCHRARIMPWRTLRFNESVCNPYNADFDGDEMNLHVPQTEEARTEAILLMGVQNNLCTPKNGEILVASTQDFLTSSFLITRKDTFYDRSTFTLICNYIGDGMDLIDLPTPAIVKPVELWSGKQLFSIILRSHANMRVYVNLTVKEKTYTKLDGKERELKTLCPNDGFVYFRNSELISGQVGKVTLGNGNKDGLFSVLL